MLLALCLGADLGNAVLLLVGGITLLWTKLYISDTTMCSKFFKNIRSNTRHQRIPTTGRRTERFIKI